MRLCHISSISNQVCLCRATRFLTICEAQGGTTWIQWLALFTYCVALAIPFTPYQGVVGTTFSTAFVAWVVAKAPCDTCCCMLLFSCVLFATFFVCSGLFF